MADEAPPPAIAAPDDSAASGLAVDVDETPLVDEFEGWEHEDFVAAVRGAGRAKRGAPRAARGAARARRGESAQAS